MEAHVGRAVDRRRVLEERLARMPPEERPSADEELATIARRIRFVYLSILFAVVSALFICLLIACLLLFLREIFVAVSAPRHIPR